MPENHTRMVIQSVCKHALAGEHKRQSQFLGPSACVGRAFRNRAIKPLWAAFVLALLALPALTSAAVLGEVWAGHLGQRAVDATLGDLDGDGLLEVIVVTEDRLFIYTWNAPDHRFQLVMSTGGFPAPISSVATADTTGIGRDDIWIGMHGSGSIQLYSLEGEGLRNHGTITRLWTSVAQLHVVDVDADGLPDLLAVGQDGVSVLLRNANGGFNQVWRTPPGDGPDQFVAIGRYTDAPEPAIAIGKGQGLVSIYRWQLGGDGDSADGEFVKMVENYPWGVIRAVDLVPRPEGHRADLYIATTQNLLYKYTWDGTTSRHVSQWQQSIANTARALQALHAPELQNDLWVGIHADRLTAWRLESGGLREAWQLPEKMAWIAQTPSGHLITFSSDGYLRVIGPVPETHLRVERAGKGYALEHPPIIEGDELFLAATDLSRILGLRAWTSRNGTRLTGVASWFQFFMIDADAKAASINGRGRPLSAAARMEGEVLYVPITFAQHLGFEYEWIEPIRSLTFF